MTTPKPPPKRHRSAVSGKYASAAKAKAAPREHVEESGGRVLWRGWALEEPKRQGLAWASDDAVLIYRTKDDAIRQGTGFMPVRVRLVAEEP